MTGLLDDVPDNAHFSFTFLASLTGYDHPDRDDWVRWNQFYTYLLLDADADPAAVAAALPGMLAQHMDAERVANANPRLQPLTDIHLRSNLFREMTANGNIRYVYLFLALAGFILMIACVNFMNLTTARSTKRAREVGIRKTSGAARASLVQQFLSEAITLSALAMLMALVLVALALPAFNTLTGKALTMTPFQQPLVVLVLLSGVVFVGLLAGGYPALALSRYTPAAVLSGAVRGVGSARVRQGLVVFQFVLSVVLIAATLGVQAQLDFIQQKRLGFNHEHLVVLPIRTDALRTQGAAFKDAVLGVPGVVSVAASGNLPGGGDWGFPLSFEGVADEDRPPMRILAVDRDFLGTYEMNIMAGRAFSPDRPADVGGAVLLNEAAVAALGWRDTALGKTVTFPPSMGFDPMPVVGMVEDFHFRSLHEAISPLLFFVPPPAWMTTYSVRVSPEQVDETLAGLEAVWATFEPAHPFTFRFLDQSLTALYAADQQTADLLRYAAFLAILIACLGLFGLAAFTAEQRTKEIGIRKVMGASVGGIVTLLSKDFLKLVALAFVLACPLAYVAMQAWLDAFAYQAAVGLGLFAAAGGLALAIALLTVSYQALRAATADPVKSLRYE